MADDLKERLARYRTDLDAAVLDDLARRRPGRTGIGLTAEGDEVDDAVPLDLYAPDRSSDERLPERKLTRHGRSAAMGLVAASVAAIAVTAALLTAPDDEREPRDIPGSSVASTASLPSVLAPTTTLPPPTLDDLVPVGAAPSGPETGELIVAVSKVHDGAWFLYADGRLISLDDRRGSAPGWIEQRLTPEGVERVRADFLASGVFDPSRQPTELPPAVEGPFTIPLLRDGDLLLVGREGTEASDRDLSPCASPEIEPEGAFTKCDLIRYMRDLELSVPPNEWVVQEFTRYLPAKYTACFTRDDPDGGTALTDLQAVLAQMPAPISELLAGREPTRTFMEAADSCFDLSVAETRVLAASLLETFEVRGFLSKGATFGFGTRVDLVDLDVGIGIWPLLPAGGTALWGW